MTTHHYKFITRSPCEVTFCRTHFSPVISPVWSKINLKNALVTNLLVRWYGLTVLGSLVVEMVDHW